MSVIEDIKQSKTYILGVIAFATTVAGFLTQVWHFAPEPTILIVAGFAVLILYVGLLLYRSEKRQALKIKEIQTSSQDSMGEIKECLEELKDLSIENQRSTIRIEMNDMIERNPSNHDTIIRYAEKYFITLKADWVETDLILNWIEAEEQAGRKVHLPSDLFANIQAKHLIETKDN